MMSWGGRPGAREPRGTSGHRRRRPAPGLALSVYLDVDRNAGTGQLGRDRRIQIGSDGVPDLRGWDGAGWNVVLPKSTVTATWLGEVSITIDRGELGAVGTGFDFDVETVYYADPSTIGDHLDDRAPDAGRWSYDFGSG